MATFNPQEWIDCAPKSELPHYVQLFHADLQTKAAKSQIISEHVDLIDHLNSNMADLTTKEKAIAFKLFSILKLENLSDLSILLSNLESD